MALDPGRGWSWAAAAATLAWVLLVLTLAEVARVRRERAATHRRALVEQRRRRDGEDRLRIAQELHDVVAHHMSLINVQASVALHLRGPTRSRSTRRWGSSRPRARKPWSSCARSSRCSARATGRPHGIRPEPGGLDDLVERSRLRASTSRPGRPAYPAVATRVELAAYPVVQEAVTNVVRHSGAGRAEVVVEHRPAGSWSRSTTTGAASVTSTR